MTNLGLTSDLSSSGMPIVLTKGPMALTSIDLSTNCIASGGCAAIATRCLARPALVAGGDGNEGGGGGLLTLDLSGNSVRPAGAQALAAAFGGHAISTRLKRRHEGAADRFGHLFRGDKRLQRTLMPPDVPSHPPYLRSPALPGGLATHNASLTSLRLRNTQLGEGGAGWVRKILQRHRSVGQHVFPNTGHLLSGLGSACYFCRKTYNEEPRPQSYQMAIR